MENLEINASERFKNPSLSFWKHKRVLITGHTGFKGSWLVTWLNSMGANVFGISLNPQGEINLFNELKIKKSIDHRILDITDYENLSKNILEIKPEIIFHLAAQPLVRDSYSIPKRTWDVNVMGTINVLNSCIRLDQKCVSVFITTDKVYKNQNLQFAFREDDPLGGSDPYSSSKAASEIAIKSWQDSFCGNNKFQKDNIFIGSARAGNVLGGGDWACDRIFPDIVRSLVKKEKIKVRNPKSVRPWQHVIEPLSGYLILAEFLSINETNKNNSFNFGPMIDSNQNVETLVNEALETWPGDWIDISNKENVYEANDLRLAIDKAYRELNWMPRWSFKETIGKTINWYKNFYENPNDIENLCLNDLRAYLDN